MTGGTDGRADFAGFVTARSQRLLRTAYLLTQDRGTAEDLLQTALAKSWQAWGRIDDDPEPYVRSVLVNTYTSRWRRRRRGEVASGEPPEVAHPDPAVGVDERHALWQAIARLPRRQRAVIVLRHLEDLSEAETARVLGVSVGTVKSQASDADLAVTEPGLTVVLDEWTDQLPTAPGRLGAVERQVRERRTRVRIAGAATVCAVLVAGVLVAGHRGTVDDQRPAVRRGPSHPALTFPTHFAGSAVSGQVSGSGRQTRTTTLTWPANEQLAVVVQCSTAGGLVQIAVTGQSQPIFQACSGPDPTFVGDGAEYFPHVPAGSVVRLEATANAGVTGPWAVGVLTRDPHWLPGGSPAATWQGKTLQAWLNGGTGGTGGTVELTVRRGTRPVFVLACGQPGRLSLLINRHDVGTVSCADAAWSTQVLPVSAQSLSAAGWAPGRRALLSFGWEGTSWAYVGVAVYSR